MSKLHVEDYREAVSSCRTCKGCTNVINTPFYGTGCRQDAALMIIAQNPPQTVRHHGAYMLHYKDAPVGPHEVIVHGLVAHLGLTPKQVFATQATKCPTLANETPPMYVAKACAGSFLEQEIRDCNPRVILTFGQQAEQVVGDLLRFKLGERPEGYDQSYPVEVNGSTPLKIVRRSGSIIAAPHPSTVGRFAKHASWGAAILRAYTDAQQFERPLTVVEQ